MKNCPTCGGEGTLSDGDTFEECMLCEGTGQILQSHQAALDRISRLQKAVEKAEVAIMDAGTFTSGGHYCGVCKLHSDKHGEACPAAFALQAIKEARK